jgi:hypothetical protein
MALIPFQTQAPQRSRASSQFFRLYKLLGAMPAFRAPQRLANASEIAGATREVPFSPRETDDCPSQYHWLLVHALHPVGVVRNLTGGPPAASERQ